MRFIWCEIHQETEDNVEETSYKNWLYVCKVVLREKQTEFFIRPDVLSENRAESEEEMMIFKKSTVT